MRCAPWSRPVSSALGGPLLSATAAGGPNIAVGDPAAASSSHGEYGAANITDGNQGSYWQNGGSSPAPVGADRPRCHRADRRGRPETPAGWESRDQTLSVQGSADSARASASLKSSATYAFSRVGNTVTVEASPATRTRFVRIDVTANTGWRAAQLSGAGSARGRGGVHEPAAGRRLTASSAPRGRTRPGTETTGTRPPTGRAPTTTCRSGSRPTSARPVGSTASCCACRTAGRPAARP